MKNIILYIVLATTSGSVLAQDCKDFYYLQDTKTVEMTIYNRKDKSDGVVTYKISDVKNNNGSIEATIHSEMVNEKGKSLSQSVVKAKCTGGVLMMDMSMFIPSAQQQQLKNIEATADAVYLDYPANMKAGDQLKDGLFTMDMKQEGGINTNVSVELTDRNVIAQESITTTAGTWNCFKITYKNKIVTKIAGIGIPVKLEATEWFAPGFGVVKTESKYGRTEITAIK